MNKWENEDVILDYFDGRMTGKELEEFNKEKRHNQFIQNKLSELKESRAAIIIHGRAKLSKKLKEIEESISTEKMESITNESKTIIMNTEKKKRFPIMGLAAAAVVLLVAVFAVQTNKSVDTDALYAQNHQPNTNVTNKYLDKIASSGFAGADSDTSATITLPTGKVISQEEYLLRETARKDALTTSLSLFKKGNWAKARVALHAYTSEYVFKKEDHQVALFHLAKAMMNSEDYQAASEKYEEFLSGEKLDKEIMDVAEFDRAIVWLQLNPKEAKMHLHDIALNNAHTYQSSAKGLYDSL